jgi:Na+/glutamate symporter
MKTWPLILISIVWTYDIWRRKKKDKEEDEEEKKKKMKVWKYIDGKLQQKNAYKILTLVIALTTACIFMAEEIDPNITTEI